MMSIAVVALIISLIGAGFAGWSAYSAHESRKSSRDAADAATLSAAAAERSDDRDAERRHEEKMPQLQFSPKGTEENAIFLVVQNLSKHIIDELTFTLLPTGENPLGGFAHGDSSTHTLRRLGSHAQQIPVSKYNWDETATANFLYTIQVGDEHWGPILAETVTFKRPPRSFVVDL